MSKSFDKTENKEYNIFRNKKELDDYTAKFAARFTTGEVQFVDDITYMWNGTEWTELTVQSNNNSGISMTMYDLNQQIISQLPDHTEEQLVQDKEIINNFHIQVKGNYYMMLCKEASYYTVFIPEEENNETFGDVVIDCAQDLGSIRSVENIDNVEIEIWVKDAEMYCIHLFKYDNGIVKFRG